MTDGRFSRQVLFSKVGKKGQTKLAKSKVTIIGVGGLGTVCAEILARAGIGTITLVDNDKVELSNLQRQSLYTMNDIGESKVQSAADHLRKINPGVKLKINKTRINENNIDWFVKGNDLILDCTDNMETRYIISDSCCKYKKPWIYASVAGAGGSIMFMHPKDVCLRCLYPNKKKGETASTSGIITPLTHFFASVQTTMAMKYLLEKKYNKGLFVYDLWNNTEKVLTVKKNPKCKH
ncbi:MAG: HesA/MoeB/ThiF family protein [Candidatus Diapherotrites archaeon]|nr:HesA/MoeB/ThiF family protein [Candidatus Diapherotrites archaeon]